MNTVLFNTIIHLKPKQIIYRIYRKLIKTRISQVVYYKQRACTKQLINFPIKKTTFILDEISKPTDWNRVDRPKLYLYQLHYFDFIHTFSKNKARHLFYQWIDENPIGMGNGWEPYPISQRIINWVKWLIQNDEQDKKILTSLYLQSRYLFKNIEYHLLGNHLFANAIALMFSGLFFCDEESQKWLKKGEEIFLHEIEEQILKDGGHFERSPMYHAKMLGDILDLYNILNIFSSSLCQRSRLALSFAAPNMNDYLSSMTFPDGEVAYFNDSVSGFYFNEADLKEYAASLFPLPLAGKDRGVGSAYYPDTGFARLQKKHVILLADIGSVGPSYIPGHAHAESLSFEMAYDGQRVLVNTGVTTYEENQKRLDERSTQAHNCLVLDGKNSSQIWKSFRVGKRAKVIERSVDLNNQCITAAHDGYKKIIHERKWQLTENYLIIQDKLSGQGEHLVELYFHFHPDVTIKLSDKKVIINFHDTALTMGLDAVLQAEIISTYYAKTFYQAVENQTLKLSGRILLPATFAQTIYLDCHSRASRDPGLL